METHPDTPFIPGLALSEDLYREAVEPILARQMPELVYSAALLGTGSEVLGLDTPQSRDHDWGPRLQLFLSESDRPVLGSEIERLLSRELPGEIQGYPIDLAWANASSATGRRASGDPAHHGVTFHTVRGYFQQALGLDPQPDLNAADWLSFPQQVLRSLTSGKVFHDGLGALEPLRARLSFYPQDVWLYVLAAQWRRISQVEAFAGRCAQVGDELGSRLVAAELVQDLMRLCFLIERQYAPYSKWFGTAFRQLACARELLPVLSSILEAASWQEREQGLAKAYSCLAGLHNDLHVTAPLPTGVSPFYDRPFLVLHADLFAQALRTAITDPQVQALPEHIGAVDQWIDSTDVLGYPARLCRVKQIYLKET